MPTYPNLYWTLVYSTGKGDGRFHKEVSLAYFETYPDIGCLIKQYTNTYRRVGTQLKAFLISALGGDE
jgi:hypothetical protein